MTHIPVFVNSYERTDTVVGWVEDGLVRMREGYELTQELVEDVFGTITFDSVERTADGRIRSFRIVSYGPLRLRPERAYRPEVPG